MSERDKEEGFAVLLGLGPEETGPRKRPSKARAEDKREAVKAVRRALAVDGSDEDLEDALDAYLAVRGEDD